MKVEYLIVKEENQHCNSETTFINLLRTNGDIKLSSKEIRLGSFVAKYSLKTALTSSNSKKERYFLLQMTVKDVVGKNKDGQIEKFTELCRSVKKTLLEASFNFLLTTIWDDVSAYYAILSYPLINEIENLMRKLIFKFMLMKIGSAWLDEATPIEIKETIISRADEKKNKKLLLQQSLYEADFIQLGIFLFKPYPSFKHNEILKKVAVAKKLNDLSLSELQELNPKSNWDKYFSKVFTHDKLEESWKALYELRIKVAHNKIMTKSDYHRITTLTSEIRPHLIKAIDKVDNISISEKDSKEVTEAVLSDVLFMHRPGFFSNNLLTKIGAPEGEASTLPLFQHAFSNYTNLINSIGFNHETPVMYNMFDLQKMAYNTEQPYVMPKISDFVEKKMDASHPKSATPLQPEEEQSNK